VIPLAAPAGSKVISPLSTLLVFAPNGVSDMEQAIMFGFSIPSRFTIGQTDAYHELVDRNVSLLASNHQS
jgi:hypothetical protein